MACNVTMKSPAIARIIQQTRQWKDRSKSPPPAEGIRFDINKVLSRPSMDHRVVAILMYSPESGREELIVTPHKLETKLTVISDDGRHLLRYLPLRAVPLFGTEAQRSALLMSRFRTPGKDWFGYDRTVNTALRILLGEHGVRARLTLRNTTAGMRAAAEAVRAERDYLYNQSVSRQDDLDVRMWSAAFCTSSDEHCVKMDKRQTMKAIRYKCEDLGIAMLGCNHPERGVALKESTELAIMLCRYLELQTEAEEARALA